MDTLFDSKLFFNKGNTYLDAQNERDICGN